MAHQLDHYRLLGRSGLRVSPLSLGTMTFGIPASWGTSDAEADQMLKCYMERGGNFVDTANFYGSGGSERVLGKLIKGVRDRLVISTKYSLTMAPGDANASGNHRKNMIRSVEESLARMGTDYIDLLYLHIWDSHTPVEEILRAFDDLVRMGKVTYIGISDTPAWQISRMQAIADLRGWSPLVALQLPYNLTERDAERDLMPMAREMGLGVLPWSPLAGGVLTGKYTKADLPSGDEGEAGSLDSRKGINLATGRLSEKTLGIADEVKAIAGELDKTPAQVALAWTLVNPAVTSTLLGVRTFKQLEDNLGALDVTLSSDQIARLEEVSKIDLGFPHSFLNSPQMPFMFGGITVEPRGR